MTEQHGELGITSAEEGLAGQARWLGQHRSAVATPFGDVVHVY